MLFETRSSKSYTCMTALDFSRAFDMVNLSILFQRISIFSDSSFTNWSQSYYCNRRQAMKYGSVLSEFKSLTSGVPQGSCLAPKMFIIYLNNMLDSINTCLTLACADDVTIVNVGHTAAASASSAESMVADILAWANNNGFVLNFAKILQNIKR